MREGYDGIGIFENEEEEIGGFSLEDVVRSAVRILPRWSATAK